MHLLVHRLAFVLSPVVLFACGRAMTTDQAPAAPGSSSPAVPGQVSPAAREPLGPEFVTFLSGPRTLGGFLYRPAGAGPFPAVVFNHGSEPLPGSKPDQATFYVGHGFVLFVPHRRGQGRSTRAGAYINTAYDPDAPDSTAFADELVAQSDDVMAAIAYVASLPYVDGKRIATAGCSLGGIESLLAAERGTGIVAAVDFAGAAITWAKNAPLRERMKIAARNAKVPVFFIQAENDYDTTPSRVLSEEMKQAGKPMQVHIFPPNGTGAREGHGLCRGGEHPPWGDEVLAFLAAAMGPGR
jgi:dienelactone hydrolase